MVNFLSLQVKTVLKATPNEKIFGGKKKGQRQKKTREKPRLNIPSFPAESSNWDSRWVEEEKESLKFQTYISRILYITILILFVVI